MNAPDFPPEGMTRYDMTPAQYFVLVSASRPGGRDCRPSCRGVGIDHYCACPLSAAWTDELIRRFGPGVLDAPPTGSPESTRG